MTPAHAWRRILKRVSRLLLPSSRRIVVHTHINDYGLLVLANEEVGRAIHFGKNYESSETRYLEKVIASDSICIDVGANIGYFAMLMAKIASKGKVYAFEPIPLNASLLRASAELNGFVNVQIIQSAVGAAEGEADLAQSSDSAYSSIRDTKRKPIERVIRVPMVTLDKFAEDHIVDPIAVLKVDVEGAEDLVLCGSHRLLSDPMRRPRRVMIELSDENLTVYETHTFDIVNKMRSIGYTPFFVDKNGELSEFRMKELNKFYNVVFLAPEATYRG